MVLGHWKPGAMRVAVGITGILALCSCRHPGPACARAAPGWTVQQVTQECGEPDELVVTPFAEELQSECSAASSEALLYHSDSSTTVLYVNAEDRVACIELKGTFFMAH